jgi:predicted transcriptional regulator
MATTLPDPPLSRRERQIMDVVLRVGEASVADVLKRVPDAAGYNAVRNTLTILERKGHLRRRRDGNRHLYAPAVRRELAGRAAVKRVLRTFFAGQPRDAILTMLDVSARDFTDAELEELRALIAKSRARR